MKTQKDVHGDADGAPAHLRKLPPYRNTQLRSLLSRIGLFLSVLQCRITGARKPLFVVLVTNNDCNLNCSYCYGRYGERSSRNNFTTGELIGIINQLHALGTRSLTLHGGESLLRPDIGEIIGHAKGKGLHVSLNTNGLLVPSRIDDLRQLDALCVSLDGGEEAHDAVRGRGTWRKALRAIDLAVEEGIPVSAHATLTRHNRGDMRLLCELARSHRFRLQFSILYNTGKLAPEEVLSDEEVRKLIAEGLALKRQGYPLYYSEAVLETILRWPYPVPERPMLEAGEPLPAGAITCRHGELKYQIDADGRVVTCWRHDAPDAPNLRQFGLAEALMLSGKRRTCRSCCFLSNNEHNLLFGLSPRGLLGIIRGQLGEIRRLRGTAVRTGR